ncbi:hypothetical protein THIOSC15_2440003 [uncultured Thiomicrorhabdus sp.]
MNWLENVVMRDKRMSFSILPSVLPLELMLPKFLFPMLYQRLLLLY